MDAHQKILDALLRNTPDMVPTAVGRATIAWNSVSYAFFQLFLALTGLDHNTAKAAFFVVKSDRSQRDMVAEIAKVKLIHDPQLTKQINAQLGDANKLAGKRNDVLHVIYLDGDKPSKVKIFQDAGHLKGKSGHDLVDSIHKLTIECLDLSIKILEAVSAFHEKRQASLEEYRNRIFPPTVALMPNHLGFGLLKPPANNPPSSETEDDQ